MKTKLTIKQKKEAAQKAALLQRITDIYSGAQGSAWGDGDFATASILENAIHALKGVFGDSTEWSYMWECHCIGRFDSPETACEFLYDAGIRA